MEDGGPVGAAREASHGSAVKLGAELLSRGLQLFTTLLLARSLGAGDFGAFGVSSAVAVVAAEAADLGLHGTASRALVAGTASLRAIVSAKLRLGAAFALTALLLWPWAPLFTPLLFWFLGSGWVEILGVALRARARRGLEALVLLVLRGLGLIGVASVLSAGGGVVACAWILAFSTVPALALAAHLARRAESAAPSAPHLRFLPLLRSSWPLAVNGGLALLSLRVELLVVGLARGAEEAGYFGATLAVVQVLNSVVPTSLAAGAMPQLTREAMAARAGSPRPDDAVRRRTAGFVALAASAASAGLFLVAPALVERVYGEAYAPAGLTLGLLALALLPLFLNGLLSHCLVAAEQARLLPRLTGVRVALAGALALALVPVAGGPGAAVGFGLSEAVLLVLNVRAARAAAFPVGVVRPTLVALLAALPLSVAVAPVRDDLLAAVFLGLAVFVATLALLWRVPRLRRELGYA